MTEQTSVRDSSRLSSSHGDDSQRIRRARAATELAELASGTALLMDIIAVGGNMPAPTPQLLEDASRLAEELRSIAKGLGRDHLELPYRQLVPVQVWTDADLEELQDLAEVAPPIIETLLSGEIDQGRAKTLSAQLRQLARRLQNSGDRLLAS